MIALIIAAVLVGQAPSPVLQPTPWIEWGHEPPEAAGWVRENVTAVRQPSGRLPTFPAVPRITLRQPSGGMAWGTMDSRRFGGVLTYKVLLEVETSSGSRLHQVTALNNLGPGLHRFAFRSEPLVRFRVLLVVMTTEQLPGEFYDPTPDHLYFQPKQIARGQ